MCKCGKRNLVIKHVTHDCCPSLNGACTQVMRALSAAFCLSLFIRAFMRPCRPKLNKDRQKKLEAAAGKAMDDAMGAVAD